MRGRRDEGDVEVSWVAEIMEGAWRDEREER